MKALFFVLVIALALCEGELYDLFNQIYGKTPANDYKEKLAIFNNNVEIAKNYNELGDATFGITEFSDMSPEEFAENFLMKPFSPEEHHARLGNKFAQVGRRNFGEPDNWNWADEGAVVDVKNQASCGSCWAFSAIGNIEGQWKLAGNKLISLSEQQLVDCDTQSHGCNGGWMDYAFESVIKTGGLNSEEDYPYYAKDRKCVFDKSKVVAKIDDFEDLSKDEEEIKTYLYKKGPISVALDATPLQFYRGGIVDTSSCSASRLNHGVLLVGYGEEDGAKYWVVKNSWGERWGEKGYFRIARGKGMCGINEACSSAIVH